VAVSFIGGGNQSTRRKPPTCCKYLTNFITYCCIEYTSPWVGFKLTTLVVIGADCIGNCKSIYHTITTTKAPDVILAEFKIKCHNLANFYWNTCNTPGNWTVMYMCVRGVMYMCVRGVMYMCVRGVMYMFVRGVMYMCVRGVMYMCVRGIGFASVSTIFLLDFETVLTAWYFLFLFYSLFLDVHFANNISYALDLEIHVILISIQCRCKPRILIG